MANILTAPEAATVLRTEPVDANMLDLLPLVDAYVRNATGRDWTLDNPVRPEAKAAARMLLVRWHEDPGGMAAGTALGFGLTAALVQLEALALELLMEGVPDKALAILASFPAGGGTDVAASASLVVIFNHDMVPGAINAATLKDDGGSAISTINSLDPTGRILTIDPVVDLQAGATYRLILDDIADVYGQTLSDEIHFSMAG